MKKNEFSIKILDYIEEEERMRTLDLSSEKISFAKNSTVITRTAIKGITMKNGRVLLLKTAKGDYKFPGGGQESGENDYQTLLREYGEEVGKKIHKMGELLYAVTELSRDKFNPSCYFQMISRYYLCSVENENVEKNLDYYERELDMTPVFVDVNVAIRANINCIDTNAWTKRETYVLKELENDLRNGIVDAL